MLSPQIKNRLSLLLRIAIGTGILFALFKFIPYNELRNHIQQVNLPYVILAFLCFFSVYCISVIRWRILLKVFGLNINFKEAWLLLVAGLFFNLFAPSVVASDVFRISILHIRNKNITSKVTSTIILSRTSGFLGLFTVACISLLFGSPVVREPEVLIALIALAALLCAMLVVIFSETMAKWILFGVRWIPKLYNIIGPLLEQTRFFRSHPLVLLQTLIYSIIIHSGVIASFYIVALALGIQGKLLEMCSIVPIIMVLVLLPITIAGLGTRELGSVYFMSKIGITHSVALGISLINFVFIIASSIIGGFLYLLMSHKCPKDRFVLQNIEGSQECRPTEQKID